MSIPSCNRPRILIFNPFFVPAYRGGGPIRTIDAIIAEHHHSYQFDVFAGNRDLGEADPLPVESDNWVSYNEARVYYVDTHSPKRLISGFRSLRKQKYDAIYLNSFFSPPFSILPAILFNLGFFRSSKLIIAPRGEFGAAPLSMKRPKKNAYIRIAKAAGIYRRAEWHASSEQEEKEIHCVFPESKVGIRENEVALPKHAAAVSPRRSEAPVRFVYIGRLAKKKGVHTAIAALHSIDFPLVFNIFGEFEDSEYQAHVKALVENLPSRVDIAFMGSIEHAKVREQFSLHDYFLFPTLHENFGHTIAESMSASCPVVACDVTPFTKAISEGEGVIVEDHSTEAWTSAIRTIAARTDEEHIAARSATADAYETWRQSASKPSIFEILSMTV